MIRLPQVGSARGGAPSSGENGGLHPAILALPACFLIRHQTPTCVSTLFQAPQIAEVTGDPVRLGSSQTHPNEEPSLRQTKDQTGTLKTDAAWPKTHD